MERILVTGANGFLGARVVAALERAGYAVRAFVRPGRSVAGDNVEILAGLAVGNRVVVRGAFNLKDGDRIQVGR